MSDVEAICRLAPFEEGPFALRMGVRPVAEEAWLEVDERLAEHRALKRRELEAHRSELVGDDGSPDAVAAAAELHGMVREWFAIHRDEELPDPGTLDPVAAAALSTQEDWCLVHRDAPFRVLAVAVGFPTRWRPAEKVGSPVREVHGPVWGYDARLGAPVDRFLERLRSDRPVWRANWNLVDDPALCQPYVPEPGRRWAGEVSRVPTGIHLRVERQTLRRLPDTGHVAFGIRVHQAPVGAFTHRPDLLGRLRAAVEALPGPTFDYKGLGAFWSPLQRWLDERTEASEEAKLT